MIAAALGTCLRDLGQKTDPGHALSAASDVFRQSERSVAVGSAMVIYMPLGKDGAEPAEKRSAAGIRGQWRTALTIDLTKTIELRVKRVGEIMAAVKL